MDSVLDRVNVPADLKSLSVEELDTLAGEVRALIIDTVSKTGGHLAASLGVVDLTIALLRAFDPPADKLVWDVGHQTYAHKILTGRKDRFHTLRQKDGISGFLKRAESEYDAFGAGHSGTALSAALGMAVARDMRKGDEHVVAVLGDGAAGCGISYEAMNNVHSATGRMIVVLNDNEMSIAANVGALSRYLGHLLASPRYNRWKRSVETVATKMKMGLFRSAYYRLEESIKGLFLRSVIFEEFGLRYIGPIDGHNIHALIDALMIAREYDRPIVLHVSTRKGKGFGPAEEHPEKWHGTPAFDPKTGEPASVSSVPSYSKVFGCELERLAEENEKIVAITAAMPMGTGLSGFAEKFPDRFFDVGISEEHAAVFAAGMAAEGLVPVFAVYSTFIQRSIDYIIHDICLQDLPVVICLDRAGVVGDDGPTHHGVFDIALLRPVPNLVIMQPKDEAELASMLYTATRAGRPVVIRYPRGAGPGRTPPRQLEEIEIGKAEIVRTTSKGKGIWFWALGDMVTLAEETVDLLADKGITAGVVNPRFVRPLDEALLGDQERDASLFVTIENGVVKGGFGAGVEEFLAGRGAGHKVLKFGWPDEFIPHGEPKDLMADFGLTAEAIAEKVAKR
ncbi:1-deoxy-D-xylulose-5-phosphate synthase [Verrucomicrobiota bacterium]